MTQPSDANAAMPPAEVEGACDPGFAPVREAFRDNFRQRGELGGALCVMAGGRVVVDLWGGWADPGRARRWRPDTLVDVFSVGKGLIAVCAARLAGQGRLDLGAEVARYWPEFGAAGKDAITVRQLLSHQAGLPAVRRRLAPGSMLDWPVMTAALAAQEPWWEPGSGHGYHVVFFLGPALAIIGWLLARAWGLLWPAVCIGVAVGMITIRYTAYATAGAAAFGVVAGVCFVALAVLSVVVTLRKRLRRRAAHAGAKHALAPSALEESELHGPTAAEARAAD